MKKEFAAAIVGAFLFATGAAHASSLCDADAGNLVTNCGFEGDSYTDGSGDTLVPLDWAVVSPGASWKTGFNGVTGNPHSGSNSLQDGNFPDQGLDGVSQTIADVVGATYDVSFYLTQNASNSPGDQAYDVYWGGHQLLAEDGDIGSDAYTEFSYDVTGTGSDLLQFEGYSSGGRNYLDDVEVNFVSGPPTAAPEPASLALFGAALVGLFGARRRKA